MHNLRYICFLLIVAFSCVAANAQQAQFSLNMDIGIVRSFKEGQQFWAPGQTIWANFHLSPKNGVYVFFNYYINGKFSNDLAATAKSPVIVPQQVAYTNNAKLKFMHISAGWKRYLTGIYNREEKGNLYAYAGLGLMMGKVENIHSVSIDTADYTVPVLSGNGSFKRLTIDPGIGYETYLGGDIYMYIEGRTLIPLTDYPSPYLLVNTYAPVNASVHVGLRLFFD